MKTPSENKGFALIEIIVASTIISLVLLASGQVAAKTLVASRQALYESQASFLLSEAAEAVKTIRDTSWATISGATPGTTYYLSWSGTAWSLTTTPTTDGSFTRTVVFSNVYRDGSDDIATSGTLDTGTKKVTVTISWQNGGEVSNRSFSLYIANIFS